MATSRKNRKINRNPSAPARQKPPISHPGGFGIHHFIILHRHTLPQPKNLSIMPRAFNSFPLARRKIYPRCFSGASAKFMLPLGVGQYPGGGGVDGGGAAPS